MLDPPTLDLLTRANAARRVGGRDADAEAALQRAFGCDARLAVYGTLAPGRSNHRELQACCGDWSTGTVRGHLGMREYPMLVPDPSGPEVRVDVLTSAALPAHWARLDEFEGADYVRLLVPLRRDAATTIANLYAFVG